MEDKKNIVIKVKYPATGKKAVQGISAPKVITEWNVKRILLALAVLLLFIVLLCYFFKPDVQKPDLESTAVLPDKMVNTQVKTNTNTKTGIRHNITRALLTFTINNNEPAGEIKLPLKLSKKKSTSVYYFVELTAMKGQTVYHEWLLDGELITRKKVNISDNIWRTSSRQLFVYSTRTHWTVRLVDEKGRLLNEISFNVIYE